MRVGKPLHAVLLGDALGAERRVLQAHRVAHELRIGLVAVGVHAQHGHRAALANCSARALSCGIALMHQPQPRYQKSSTTTLPR